MRMLLAFAPVVRDRAAVLRSMGSEFRAKQLGLVELACWLAIVGGLLLLVSVAASAWRRGRKRRTRSQPGVLFRELCHAHQLSSADRRLLRQLASHRQLTMAAEIFLRPECFDHPLPSRRLTLAQPRLASLRSHLFPDGASNETVESPGEVEPGIEDTVSMSWPTSMADTVEMQNPARPLPQETVVAAVEPNSIHESSAHAGMLIR